MLASASSVERFAFERLCESVTESMSSHASARMGTACSAPRRFGTSTV